MQRKRNFDLEPIRSVRP